MLRGSTCKLNGFRSAPQAMKRLGVSYRFTP